MILYPAIDLKNNECVRLYQGDMNSPTIYKDTPANQAMKFQKDGCEYLHLIDLDGAFAGTSINKEAILSILKTTDMNIQLGGGIRNMDDIKYWFDKGINRIILGTSCVESVCFFKKAVKEFDEKIVIAIDSRKGQAFTRGWARNAQLTVHELSRMCVDYGVSTIIHTDIDCDGMMQGHNIHITSCLAETYGIDIIASGGIRNIDDFREIENHPSNIVGAVVGRAIYNNKLRIKEVLNEI